MHLGAPGGGFAGVGNGPGNQRAKKERKGKKSPKDICNIKLN